MASSRNDSYNDVLKLKTENANLKTRNSKLQSKCQSLEQNQEEIVGKLSELEKAVEALHGALISEKKKAHESTKKLEDQLSKSHQLKQTHLEQMKDLQMKLKPPRDVETLRIQIHDELAGPFMQEIGELENQLLAFREQNASLNGEKAALITTCQRLEKNLDQHQSAVSHQLRAECNALKEQVKQSQEQWLSAKESMTQALNEKDLRISTLNGRLQQATSKTQTNRDIIFQKHRAEIQSMDEVVTLQQQILVLTKKCNDAELSQKAAQSDKMSVERMLDEHQKKLIESQRHVEDAENRRLEAESEIDTLRSSLKQANEKNQKLLKEIERLQYSVEEIRGKENTYMSDIQDLQNEIHTIKHEHSIDMAEKESLIETIRQDLQLKEQEVSAAAESATKLRTNLEAKMSEVQQRVAQERSNIQREKQSQHDAEEELIRLQGQHRQLRERLQDAEKVINDLSSEREQIISSTSNQMQELEDLKNTCFATNSIREKLIHQLEEKSNEEEDMKRLLNHHTRQNKSLQKKLDAYKTFEVEIKTKVKSQNEKIRILKEKLRSSRHQQMPASFGVLEG